MVITNITFNTGTTSFETYLDFSDFLGQFTIIKQCRAAVREQIKLNAIVSSVVSQKTPHIFENVIISHEPLAMGYAAEFNSLVEALGWTADIQVSYTYN